MKSIQHKNYVLLASTGLFVLAASIVSNSQQQKSLAQDAVANNIHLLADDYFDSINTMMPTDTVVKHEILREKLRRHPNIKDAHIIRGEPVTKLYGPGKPTCSR